MLNFVYSIILIF